MKKALYFVAALCATGLVIGQFQPSPPERLSVPIWDGPQRGYFYARPRPSDFGVERAADGTLEWYVKFPAPPSTNPPAAVPVWRRDDLVFRTSRVDFDLSRRPIDGTVELYINGASQDRSRYTVTGNTVHLTFDPWWFFEAGGNEPGDRLWATYFHQP
jgi:hypothetical protein